jgi:hypothetical protein
MSFSLVEVYRRFGGTSCLHFQSRREKPSNVCGYCFIGLLFDLEEVDIVLRDFGKVLPDYMASHPSALYSHSHKNLKSCRSCISYSSRCEFIAMTKMINIALVSFSFSGEYGYYIFNISPFSTLTRKWYVNMHIYIYSHTHTHTSLSTQMEFSAQFIQQ